MNKSHPNHISTAHTDAQMRWEYIGFSVSAQCSLNVAVTSIEQKGLPNCRRYITMNLLKCKLDQADSKVVYDPPLDEKYTQTKPKSWVELKVKVSMRGQGHQD